MYILDTNVLSEIIDPHGSARVCAWVDPIAQKDLFTTALNQAEVLYGIAIMPEGRKRTRLIERIGPMFATDFRHRILPFDERAAVQFAEITGRRKRNGISVALFDSQIAAIAQATEMTLVTRNVKHFEDCDIQVINPWSL
jgi:predicted nucleic acid-binding protein